MKNILFCIPLKEGCLEQYVAFSEQAAGEKRAEWRDMLSRYDIQAAEIWHKNIGNRDYIFIHHNVGPTFEEKFKGWESSEHSFDQWCNQELMTLFDIDKISDLKSIHQIAEIS